MPTVIESMTGVSIRANWLFSNAQTLELFPTLRNPAKKNRVASLYGKNGSGKTSVAQGFREYVAVELIPLAGGSPISISVGGSPEKFFVFDEKYIEQQLKVKEQGLDAIVLFGQQVALEQQIELVTNSIIDINRQKQQQEIECSKYTDPTAITAPQYWSSQIAQLLRTGGGWAETKGIKLNGHRTAATVNDTEIESLGQLIPSLGETETKAEYDRLFTLFTSANTQAQRVTQAIQQVPIDENVEAKTAELLSKVIEKQQLTERENELLQVFGFRTIANAKGFLSDTTKEVCPTCLQEVSIVYREDILSQIENILNREVEDVRMALKQLLLTEILKDSYLQYSVLEAKAYCNVLNLIDALNQAIAAHNDAIQAKIDCPFESMNYDASIKMIAACDALNQALAILETERVAFNDAITGRPRLLNTLLRLNNEIAHYAIRNAYASLIAQKAAKIQADDKLASLIEQIRALEQQKLDLDAQRKNFQIAADEINRSLAYIFFSQDRLKLELGTDQLYHLKSNGKSVDPNKISCGERNALALCYFFTDIVKGTDANDIYNDEFFLAIDDPVSSFDLENRIGILSFLRWKIGQVLLGCPTTKALIMTHDVSVLFDLEKALQEISRECATANRPAEFTSFELNTAGITIINETRRKYNEYTRLLETIHEYAMNATSGTELFIGNTMRRVLEAFSTFIYKKGIAEISCDEAILSAIDVDKRDYFHNLMYKLVLHGESHYDEHIYGLQGMDFFSHLSTSEKQRTAQDILCFMYQLNEKHIQAHLPSAVHDIQSWCANISIVACAS